MKTSGPNGLHKKNCITALIILSWTQKPISASDKLYCHEPEANLCIWQQTYTAVNSALLWSAVAYRWGVQTPPPPNKIPGYTTGGLNTTVNIWTTISHYNYHGQSDRNQEQFDLHKLSALISQHLRWQSNYHFNINKHKLLQCNPSVTQWQEYHFWTANNMQELMKSEWHRNVQFLQQWLWRSVFSRVQHHVVVDTYQCFRGICLHHHNRLPNNAAK